MTEMGTGGAPGVATLTVRLGAITANFSTCRKLAGSAAVAAVVKADAYGLGLGPVARSLQAARCDTFFVARLEEGITLRSLVPSARIFVLDGARSGTLPALLAHDLTPVLNSLAQIEEWSAAARQERRTRDAAIHVDTGMNRLGLPPDELAILSAERKRLDGLNLVLVMSHLACSDEAESAMNVEQLGRFRAALSALPPAPASLAASGGILLGKDYLFDMVRPGLGLYGGAPQTGATNPFSVTAILTGKILQLRRVDTGGTVGYGASYRCSRPSLIATMGIGYADGLFRTVGNRGQVAVKGRRVPIVGRVSMDLVTLDVTDLGDGACAVGTEVEFLGDTITLSEAAETAGTIPYEILTSLSRRVARHYDGATV